MEDDEASARLALLCRKLGTLLSDKDISGIVSTEKIEECQTILMGQLYQNPSINFQAFQTAMKRAWKNENVEITP